MQPRIGRIFYVYELLIRTISEIRGSNHKVRGKSWIKRNLLDW